MVLGLLVFLIQILIALTLLIAKVSMKISCSPVLWTYHIGMNAHQLSHSVLGLGVWCLFLLIKCMKENLCEKRISQHCGSPGCMLCVDLLNCCSLVNVQ